MKLIFIFLSVSFTSIFANEFEPVVRLEDGLIKGKVEILRTGTGYYSFKGIPYAEPPVGGLRFQAPKPVKKWPGVLNAAHYGSDPVQLRGGKLHGSEDCLYINVFSKSLDSKLPVMVWIYGGAFQMGSSDDKLFGPEFIMERHVVLVTFNYRVDAFGFLALDIPTCPGNAGLKDQVFALKWVKKNIAMFGGDDENITIFGCSAGGASVSYLKSIPQTKGLFHKAIAQSGSALSDMAITDHGKEYGIALAEILGYKSKNPSKVFKFLSKVNADQLVGASQKVKSALGDDSDIGKLIFGPVVEKTGNNPLITKPPIEYIKNGEFNQIPFMSGVTSNEGMLFWSEIVKDYDRFMKNPEEILLFADKYDEKMFLNEYQYHYRNFSSPLDGFLRIRMDENFLAPMIREVDMLYSVHNISIFLYSFEYLGDRNYRPKYVDKFYPEEVTGAGHGDEQTYLFKAASVGWPRPHSRDDRIIEYMVNLWYNFASKGDPNSVQIPIYWPAYRPKSRNFLRITEHLKVDPDLYGNRINFWSRLHNSKNSTRIHEKSGARYHRVSWTLYLLSMVASIINIKLVSF